MCGSRNVCGLCSFGSAGILTLAITCKTYAVGLKHEVRRATAIIAWPRERGMLYVIRSRVRSSCRMFDMPAPHQTVTETSHGDDDQFFLARAVDDAVASLSLSFVVEHQSRGMLHAHCGLIALWHASCMPHALWSNSD